MINERAVDKEQIPVRVGNKTCLGCETSKALTTDTDASKRVTTDPTSRKIVDKATAVIGTALGGGVFYFENERNLAKNSSTSKR